MSTCNIFAVCAIRLDKIPSFFLFVSVMLLTDTNKSIIVDMCGLFHSKRVLQKYPSRVLPRHQCWVDGDERDNNFLAYKLAPKDDINTTTE